MNREPAYTAPPATTDAISASPENSLDPSVPRNVRRDDNDRESEVDMEGRAET